MMAIPSNGDGGEESTGGNSQRKWTLSSPLITVLRKICWAVKQSGRPRGVQRRNRSGSCARVERPWAMAAAMGLAGLRTSQLAPEASKSGRHVSALSDSNYIGTITFTVSLLTVR